ncbi:MAG: zinc-ribbon domain-containing protein [Anaerolineales bacterium]
MIIWGSKGKQKTLGQGIFFCPQCSTMRPYHRKKVSKYFTLYFIPLFETKNLGEYIECQWCLTTFRTEVLKYTQSLEQKHEQQLQIQKMIAEISEGLDAGASLQSVASIIKASGGNEEIASAAIYAVTQGKIKGCRKCGVAFKATLSYCSICGTPLTDQ